MSNELFPLVTGVPIPMSPEAWVRECFQNKWVLKKAKPVRVKFLRTSRLDEWLAGKVYTGNLGNACRLEVPEPYNEHYDEGSQSGHHFLQMYLNKTGNKEEILGELCTRNALWALPQIEDIILNFERGINPLKLRNERWLVFFIWAPRGVTQLHAMRTQRKWVIELEYPPHSRLDSCEDVLFLNP